MTRLPFQHSHSHTHWKKKRKVKKKEETFSCIKAEIVVVRKWRNYPWKVVVVEYSVVWPGGTVVLPGKFLPGLSQILRVLFVHRILKFVRLAIKKEKKNQQTLSLSDLYRTASTYIQSITAVDHARSGGLSVIWHHRRWRSFIWALQYFANVRA